MMTTEGFRTRGNRQKAESKKRIHHACLDNLHEFLEGKVSFEEWELRQDELESRLTPAPELPLLAFVPESEATQTERPPKHPKAA